MDKLSNQALIETYAKAIEFGLGEVFTRLITNEMNKRSFSVDEMEWIQEINRNQYLKSC